MPRKLRASSPGIPEHIIQRGNNRQMIFSCNDDMGAFVNWLKEAVKTYAVELHAWVLMTNHVHLLCTPLNQRSISQMMQAVGRQVCAIF